MKRNYFEPEMEILTFSMENVVTTSAVDITGQSIDQTDEAGYNAASTKVEFDFMDFIF